VLLVHILERTCNKRRSTRWPRSIVPDLGVGRFKYVGEKRLVRIDDVGRTAAVATLLDADGEPEALDRGLPGAWRRRRTAPFPCQAESASE